MNAVVIIPTYNERDNIPPLVEALLRHDGVRVLVVDDQSPDGTGELGEELGRAFPGRVSVLHRTAARGYGRSCMDGVRTAIGELLEQWAAGSISPSVGAAFPLAEGPAALQMVPDRRSTGKVVLLP